MLPLTALSAYAASTLPRFGEFKRQEMAGNVTMLSLLSDTYTPCKGSAHGVRDNVTVTVDPTAHTIITTARLAEKGLFDPGYFPVTLSNAPGSSPLLVNPKGPFKTGAQTVGGFLTDSILGLLTTGIETTPKDKQAFHRAVNQSLKQLGIQ
jgi:hypothetical protein